MDPLKGYLRLRRCLPNPIAHWLLAPCRTRALRNVLRALDRTLLRWYSPDIRLRHEFNRWAGKGLDEGMELQHMWLAENAIPRLSISSADCILDLGCGNGWASRLMAKRSGAVGRVVGLDVSDEMVRRARIKSSNFENLEFLCGSAQHIPCRDEAFTKVLSIEAFYYFEDQEKVLQELSRVVAPGGQLFLLLCIYKERPDWHSSAGGLSVPVQVRSADQYQLLFEATGWGDVHTEELLRGGEPCDNRAAHTSALLITARRSSLKTENSMSIKFGPAAPVPASSN